MSFFNRFQAPIITGLVAVAILTIISFDFGRQKSFSPVEKFFVELIGPVQKSIASSQKSLAGFLKDYLNLLDVRRENELLKDEIDRLRFENDRFREDALTTQRLRDLLHFKNNSSFDMVGAKIVGRDSSAWYKTVIIDRGSRDGMETNLPVITHRGLVGRVISTSSHYSKVLLIIDHNSSVDAVIQSTRTKGILVGQSETTCRLKYILRKNQVVSGDNIITSGQCGIFPSGILIGRVIRTWPAKTGIFQEVEVEPGVDFTRLEMVMVVLRSAQPDFYESSGGK
ncbi:MAG: rod shape-determining protein MreC [Deltaproteobacteria bacterium]|nr:rod shape-determining protein MreC [Deltaproteobacteria bacterium]